MSIITRFASRYNALDFAYGGSQSVAPWAIQIGQGNTVTGSTTIQAITNYTVDQGSNVVNPLNTNAPIIVGTGANAETVTPTSVGSPTGSAGPGVNNTSISVTATFANLHGPNEPISSGTYGLQEAINIAAANGGGEVVVTPAWFAAGGTKTIIQAAIQPNNNVNANISGTPAAVVKIVDTLNLTTWTYGPKSNTVVSAPSAATSSTVASLTTTGTWTATTIHVLFTYVTADGGETLASSDYSFTATASKAIGGSGPAASTGAVGYRVYMGTNATSACYLTPVTSANGTVIQCGPIAAFQIGTNFSVATANVAAPLIPNVSNAFPCGYEPTSSLALQQSFASVQGPFAVTGVVTAGTAVEWGKVQLPTGFLNAVNRAFRITLQGIYTPVSTATVIITVAMGSVYTGTETTLYTVTTPASSGTTASNINCDIVGRVATSGATGTIEVHGYNIIGLATGTSELGAASLDVAQTASSAIDLTAQDYIRVTINSGTANLTQSQLRTMIVEIIG